MGRPEGSEALVNRSMPLAEAAVEGFFAFESCSLYRARGPLRATAHEAALSFEGAAEGLRLACLRHAQALGALLLPSNCRPLQSGCPWR